jgi:hypothetical protein
MPFGLSECEAAVSQCDTLELVKGECFVHQMLAGP